MVLSPMLHGPRKHWRTMILPILLSVTGPMRYHYFKEGRGCTDSAVCSL